MARLPADPLAACPLDRPAQPRSPGVVLVRTEAMSRDLRDASGFGVLRDGEAADRLLTVLEGPAFAAYRVAWHRAGRLEGFPGPLHVDVELNRSCNLRCPMCTWSAETATNEPASRMTLDAFTTLIQEAVASGTRSVGFNLVNEPLLRSDLPDFVRVARRAGCLDAWLHTNGMLLTERMSEGLVRAGLTRLLVSLDSVTQPVYDQIRVGGDLGTVERNIHGFLRVRERCDSRTPLLGVCFITMAVNAHERESFIAKWDPVVDFFSLQDYFLPPHEGAVDMGTHIPEHLGAFRCAMPWQRIGVSHDGTVQPCCSFYGAQIPLGSIREGIQDLWQGETMTALRNLHREGRGAEHPVCRACMHASGRT